MAVGNVTVNGVRLAYEVSGEGDPVVLIAGTGISGNEWEVLGAGALRAAGFQVIVFDNRGVGASDGPPGPYSVAEMAADTLGLVEALGLGPVAIVGNSLGGYIGQTLAAAHPELVSALVLWVAAGRTPAFFRRLMEVEAELRSRGPLPDSWYLWQYLLISLPFPVLQHDDVVVEGVAELLAAGITWSGDGCAGQFAADVEWDVLDRDDLESQIRCPALVVAHELDIIHPPAAARAAAAAMERATYIEIPGLAHGQALDAVAVVIPQIVAFLRDAQAT